MLSIFFAATKPFKTLTLVVFILMVLAAVSESAGIALLLPIMETALGNKSEGGVSKLFTSYTSLFPDQYKVVSLVGLLLVITFAKAAVKLVLYKCNAKLIASVFAQWVHAIFVNIMQTPYTIASQLKHGETVNNIINEPSRSAQAFNDILDFASRLCMTLAIVLVLVITSWKAVLVLSICFSCLAYLVHFTTNKYIRNIGQERVDVNQALYALVSESLSGIRQVKTFNLEALQAKEAYRFLQHNISLVIKGDIVGKLPIPLGELLIVSIISVIIFYIELYSTVSLSEIFPVIGIFAIATRPLMSHVSTLVSQRIGITSYMPSLELVHSLASRKTTERTLVPPPVTMLADGITFHDVSFAYPGKEPIFQKLNLVIPKGKTTAFVGPSGTGKSTLLDLILGLLTPVSGEIVVNGKPLSQQDPVSWRKMIGFVSQDTFIFNRTVRDNILIGNFDASADKVEEAATKAFAHDFINNLPEGYNTILGDRGVTLSGGQRQRIAIARAIIRDPEILIFDEATSALDLNSEQAIQSAMKEITKNKTVIIVAHRLSTIKEADAIYTIDNPGCFRKVMFDELANSL